MSKNEKPTTSFVLSLIAGIFILINGALLGFIASFLLIDLGQHEKVRSEVTDFLERLTVAGTEE